MGDYRQWPQEHVDALQAMIGESIGSYVQIAVRLNIKFGTLYTRNSCIGRAKRLGLCKPQQYGPSTQAIMNRRARDREKKLRRREGSVRPQLLPGTSKTSAIYRRTFGPAPEMSKREMREMLTLAVRNTAAMVVA